MKRLIAHHTLSGVGLSFQRLKNRPKDVRYLSKCFLLYVGCRNRPSGVVAAVVVAVAFRAENAVTQTIGLFPRFV